jgi:hypothetical protein
MTVQSSFPKRTLFAFLLVVCSLGHALDAESVSVIRQNDIHFAVRAAGMKPGEILYFYDLISKDDAASGEAASEKSFQTTLPLDFPGVWKNRTEPYNIMITKNAYILNKDITFFNKQRLLDVSYINATLPQMKVSKNSDGTYTLTGTPSATSSLTYYSKADVAAQPMNSSVSAASGLDSELGTPDVMLVQHSYNFDTIMAVRTNKSSTVFSQHYAIAPGKTLVVAYSLSFVYNVPPWFLGGADRIRTEYVKAMQQVYSNVSNM